MLAKLWRQVKAENLGFHTLKYLEAFCEAKEDLCMVIVPCGLGFGPAPLTFVGGPTKMLFTWKIGHHEAFVMVL